jgi:hypothetical protein
LSVAKGSVVEATDTAVGFPEVAYFKTEYFLKNVNADIITRFTDINLYNSKLADTNFEYLFYLTNSEGGDPDARSLFNVDTLKQLISLGQNTVDVTVD